VFKKFGSIFKFASAISAMSANFLLLRWTAGHVRKVKIIRLLLSKHTFLGPLILYLEYIVGGLLSSKAAMWMENGDRNLLKILIYMRAIEAFILLIVQGIIKMAKTNAQGAL